MATPPTLAAGCGDRLHRSLLPALAILLLALAPARAADDLDALRAAFPPAAGTGLAEIAGCAFVPVDWADGDSFRVRAPGGFEFTLRLYGADCIERHVANDTDARRLRAQRRYFGIAGGDPAASIANAKALGAAAAAETARLLGKPFTVFTAYTDARGDARFFRVYGFVRTGDGRDLAEHLVEHGLARAYGVSRRTPAGESAAEYEAKLDDLELAAAKAGRGAWGATDWSLLPEQRREQRMEEADTRLATGAPPAPDRPLDPNTASRDDLVRVPGIGEATANRIIEARPFRSADDLQRVPGIGAATFAKIRPFFRDPAAP
jgi:endonuclease YncB( thermonuclease family)